MFIIEIPYMNLEQIYNSKQVPRWIKLKEDKFVVIHKDKALKIEQKKQRFFMNCSEDEFFKVWFEYFDLRTDYMTANHKIKLLGNKFKIVANRGQGIHIINQDSFEAFVYSRIAFNVGYEKAGKAINHIAMVCGTKHVQAMNEAGKVTWYEFPTPEMILEKFDKLGKMGKVNFWLRNLCEVIVHDNFDYIESLSGPDNELSRLMAIHDMLVFPVSEIEELLAKNFDCKVEDFANTYLNKIENKGIAYVYILHHKLNPPKEMKRNGSC